MRGATHSVHPVVLVQCAQHSDGFVTPLIVAILYCAPWKHPPSTDEHDTWLCVVARAIRKAALNATTRANSCALMMEDQRSLSLLDLPRRCSDSLSCQEIIVHRSALNYSTRSIVPKVHVSAIIRGLVGGRGMMRARPTHALLLLCVFRAGKEAAGVCDTPPCSTVRDNLEALFDDLVNGEITFYLHRENSLWLRLVVHIHYKNA